MSETEPKPVPTVATGANPKPATQVAHGGASRGTGLNLIITYKFCKAGLMLAVALWLTIAPGAAFRALELVARELTEGGLAFARAGRWLGDHLSNVVLLRGAELAWLDSISSAIEAVLLMSGKAWAEWIVILSLACLLPFEVHSIWHRPVLGKFLVLGANVLIVAYLAREQLRKAHPVHS